MDRVFLAGRAEFPDLDTLRLKLLVLGQRIVAAVAFFTRQYNPFSRHGCTTRQSGRFTLQSGR
jgi:hypothetical protein